MLDAINTCNIQRAFSRRVWMDGKVLAAGEMPLASARPDDLAFLTSMVFCTARLDAAYLAQHGGRPTTDPPPSLAPKLDVALSCWLDVLEASGTASEAELAVWLDAVTGSDCFVDSTLDHCLVVGVVDGEAPATGLEWPITLSEVISELNELMAAPSLEPGDRADAESRPAIFGSWALDGAIADDALTDPTAAALHVIRTLGISPGGSPTAEHYGATTLLVRHVRVVQKTVRFSFTAHHGAHIDLLTDDPLTRQIAQTYTVGKGPSARLFDTTPKKVNAYMQRFLPGCSVKDLRTSLCSTLAEEEIARIDEQREYPQNAEQLQVYMRDVAKFVAAKVGNRWQIHLTANINPKLFDHWRVAAGVEAGS